MYSRNFKVRLSSVKNLKLSEEEPNSRTEKYNKLR